jgi:uncharacterized protein DUF3536/glycosyl hydrolase family 57
MMSEMTRPSLILYGHFYQPPREDPFTGAIPTEHGATPYANFNEKITAECYRPNAELGSFEHISFDFGPTLASWMERAHPDVHARIIEADRANVRRFGVGNALAQAYNHTILPLASHRDKQVQIAWGLADFERRFGRRADGMWLAETAIDLESLDMMTEHGVRYTVLAPWQAAEPFDATEPYLVRLPSGRTITVFFYNGPLSGGVSFDWDTTSNADLFAASQLRDHVNHEKAVSGAPQVIVVASDGELYGHHKPWREHFLHHLVTVGAPSVGFEVTSLGRYVRDHPATREVTLRVPSAWSCSHGVARWGAGCECTEGDASWKPALREAFDHLGAQVDACFARETADLLRDPWAARLDYLALYKGWMTPNEFWRRHGKHGHAPRTRLAARAEALLEAEYFVQAMYTSCGFYFEDLDRIEPRNDIAFGRRALSLVWQTTGDDLQGGFLDQLRRTRGWRTGLTGADLYRQLPPVARDLLPPLPRTGEEPAA